MFQSSPIPLSVCNNVCSVSCLNNDITKDFSLTPSSSLLPSLLYPPSLSLCCSPFFFFLPSLEKGGLLAVILFAELLQCRVCRIPLCLVGGLDLVLEAEARCRGRGSAL